MSHSAFVNLQTTSSSMFSEILNLECTVLSPGTMEAATLDVVVATTILPLSWTFVNIASIKKSLYYVPRAINKEDTSVPLSIEDNIS